MTPDPDLFPCPQRVTGHDPTVRCAAPVEVVVDPALPAQGYRLTVDGERAVLAHADEAGRRYGQQTVDQLRGDDGALPAVAIDDHPDIAERGFMLDVSRDRVPTRATLARLVRLLAVARYTQLQLYVEHTFAYRDHEEVWRDASPLTPDDLRWLDELCAGAGIELVANQNCFGHMGRWLAHDTYRGRAECPDGVEVVPGVRFPAGVLAPTDDNAAFAVTLVREQMEAVRSRTVNVGCDETFELGRGASAARVAEVGLGTVYGEHLARIVGPLLADGCTVQVWADVLAHHPEALALLPGGRAGGADQTSTGAVTALVWNYDAPEAPTPTLPARLAEVLGEIGIDLTTPTDFATRLAPLAGSGVTTWVAPGTSAWNSLVGRLDNARANLLDAARAAVAHDIDGFLVTDWGDNGHQHPPSVSDPPLLYGGAVAWAAEANADLDLAAVVDRHAALDPTGTVGSVLEAIGTVHGRTGVVARNLSPLHAALFPHQVHLTSGTPDVDAVRGVLAVLEAAADDLGRARPGADDAATLVDELDVAIGLARAGALRLLARAGGEDVDAAERRAELATLLPRFRAAWLARARPGGLDDSAAHIERTLAAEETP